MFEGETYNCASDEPVLYSWGPLALQLLLRASDVLKGRLENHISVSVSYAP